MSARPVLGYADEENGLIARAKGGDATAFSTLVERHQNKIYRFILKQINAPAEARDLTQETLLQAYLCLTSFNGASRFSTWLLGIALNLARNHLRRVPQCHFAEYNEENMFNIANGADDPAQQHQQQATLGVLARAIEALPAEMRDYLVLVGVDRHSYEEVAQLLDVPLGTVKSGVSRARQKLRQNLALQGFFD